MRYILLLITVALLTSVAYGQVTFSVNFNVDSQPGWGPTGYDRVDYYYLPDIGVYYNVPQHKFYYSEGGRWRSSSSLPSRYSDYDLYNGHKVVVNEPTPYRNDRTYREQYASFRGRHDQESIRDSRDPKYYVNPSHPQHRNWEGQSNNANLITSADYNVERQPIWGPTGYDHVEFYYIPEIGVYYSVPQQKFFYSYFGRWRSSSSLPARYRGYDFYNSYKVVVNDPKPYLNDAQVQSTIFFI